MVTLRERIRILLGRYSLSVHQDRHEEFEAMKEIGNENFAVKAENRKTRNENRAKSCL